MIRNTLFLGIVALAFTGCGGSNGSNGNTDTGTHGCTGADCNQTQFAATIEATSAVAGDFALNDAVVDACVGTTSCDIAVSEAGDYTVTVDNDGYLFAPLPAHVANDGDTVSLNWNFDGGYGLKVDGHYTGDAYGGHITVTSEITDNLVQIDLDGVMSDPIPLTDGEFAGTDVSGETIEGSVSDDLATIVYTETAPNGNVFSDTLRPQ